MLRCGSRRLHPQSCRMRGMCGMLDVGWIWGMKSVVLQVSVWNSGGSAASVRYGEGDASRRRVGRGGNYSLQCRSTSIARRRKIKKAGKKIKITWSRADSPRKPSSVRRTSLPPSHSRCTSLRVFNVCVCCFSISVTFSPSRLYCALPFAASAAFLSRYTSPVLSTSNPSSVPLPSPSILLTRASTSRPNPSISLS